MDYQNLSIWVAAQEAGGYPVRLSESVLSGVMSTIPSDSPLRACLPAMEDALEHGRPFPTEQMANLGAELFASLFVNPIDTTLEAALGAASQSDNIGVRLCLQIDPPELASLPWEMLYHPTRHAFLATSRKTLIMRTPGYTPPIKRQPLTPPIRMLAVVAEESPEEVAALSSVVQELTGAIELRILDGDVTRDALVAAIDQEDVHVFHFIGHGVFTEGRGHLLLNTGDLVDEQVMAEILGADSSVRLVTLSACQGARISSVQPMAGMAARLASRGIPAIIAHQLGIESRMAARFTRDLYRALLTGPMPGYVDVAVTHARHQLAVHFPNTPAMISPVLFTQTCDGHILDLTRSERERITAKERARLEAELAEHKSNYDALARRLRRQGRFASPVLRRQLDAEAAIIEDIERRLHTD